MHTNLRAWVGQGRGDSNLRAIDHEEVVKGDRVSDSCSVDKSPSSGLETKRQEREKRASLRESRQLYREQVVGHENAGAAVRNAA
ncbi:hypothetical protein CEXT_797891 [Caerostris extrusa]|uniref:Uncharacterized protein n=1 Tax=Caerostris extrusa TaxID=172846 RepID=A0AAV4SN44_CAEEX|nr:hypothetical protein CEXT_797891 [Caerostris extrusa]